jgi:hypothetical protein
MMCERRMPSSAPTPGAGGDVAVRAARQCTDALARITGDGDR